MNPSRLNKALLVSNLVLVAALATLLLRWPETASSALPSSVPKSAATANSRHADLPRPLSYGQAIAESDWKTWAEALRGIGVPTRVLARLVRDGFDDQWQKRQEQAQAAYMRGELDGDGLGALSIEHDFAQEAAICAALGDEEFRKWDMANLLQSLPLRDIRLSPEETETLYDLEKNHRDSLNRLLASKLKGEIDHASLEERQATFEAAHDVKLKELLGARRHASLRGLNEGSAELQRILADVPLPKKVSFETLLAIQNQWSERRNEMMTNLHETKAMMANFEKEITRMDDSREREFERLLGSEAADQIQRQQDIRYQAMQRHAGAWGLDKNLTEHLYTTIRYYEKAVNEYQRESRALEAGGQPVDWAEVDGKVNRFAQQTEQALRRHLGDERFEMIRSNQIFPFAAVTGK